MWVIIYLKYTGDFKKCPKPVAVTNMHATWYLKLLSEKIFNKINRVKQDV